MNRNLLIYRDAEALTNAATDYITALAVESQALRGQFTVALAGGKTPQSVYTRLARVGTEAGIDWSRVFFFWGDERCVPPEHPESNYGMARRTFLEAIAVPKGNVYRIPGELPPEMAAMTYERTLRQFFGPIPRFDLVLLGMGADGHTASLFPNTPAIHEPDRWVMAVKGAKPEMTRVTLTPVALNAAAHGVILISGNQKAERLRQVFNGPYLPDLLPVQTIHTAGSLLWFVDAEAAARL
jgi:6-phosphogluconolactonase